MKAVIQRVSRASVTIHGKVKDSISKGMVILLGIHKEDTEEDMKWLAKKVAALRIFNDAWGVMNMPISSFGGEFMVISQFTLLASYKHGNRPSWINAACHTKAVPMYENFCKELEKITKLRVATGIFGADMKVELVNDGPVTICMDTRNKE